MNGARSPIRPLASAGWLAPAAIGRAATLALHDELALAPKPGLVSFIDNGSHADMDAHTFMRSLFALRRSFVQMAELGAARAPFAALERCGMAAEARMLAATGGVNTHRGAIFVLGLLCAAIAAAQADGRALDAIAVRASLQRHWGAALQARSHRPPSLPGGLAAARHGLRSASQEAALGFPTLFDTALPAWASARGLPLPRQRLQVFFSILAVLDDSNLAHRGGIEGLQFARRQASGWLAGGGAAQPAAEARAWAVHRRFVQGRLSPGGCADTLAAACLLHRVGALS
jgi:triphosphoribosyl-dephospho-CoA synthase